MNEDVKIDLNYLTEDERDIILNVVRRDEEFRKQEKERIRELKQQLNKIREQGENEIVPADESEAGVVVCATCSQPLGLFYIFTSSLCPKCQRRTCKQCQKPLKDVWHCGLCHQLREIKAQSGAWFYEKVKTNEKTKLFGSSIIRASLRRTKGTKTEKGKQFIEGEEVPHHDLQPLSEESDDAQVIEFDELAPDEGVDSISEGESESHGTTWLNNNEQQVIDQTVHEYEHRRPATQVFPVIKQISLDSEGGDSASSGFFTPSAQEDSEEVTPANHYVVEESQNFHAVTSSEDGDSHEDDVHGDVELPEDHPLPEKCDNTALNVYSSGDLDHTDDIQYEMTRNHVIFTKDIPKSDDDISLDDEHDESSSDSQLERSESVSPSLHDLTLEDALEKEDMLDDDDEDLQNHMKEEDACDEEVIPNPDDQSHDTTKESTDTAHEVHCDSEQNNPGGTLRESAPVIEVTEVSEDNQHQDSLSLTSPVGDVAASEPESDQHIDRRFYQERDHYSRPVDMSSHQRNLGIDDKEDDIDASFAKYVGADMGSLKLKDQLSMGSRESIVSTYSNAGDNFHCPVSVTGEVLFGFKYNFKKNIFELQIHKARDLAAMDTKKNRSDPYIKTYLLPDRTKSGKRKTKVKKHTVNPEYDEILQYKISYDELLTRTLWLTVWNSDRFGHNAFLGEVMLSIDQHHEAGFSLDDPSPQWYPLHERDGSDSLLSYHGEIIVALKYVPPEAIIEDKKHKKTHQNGQLHVHIKEARNLLAKDSNGFSDPFCKIYLLPDKSKKTKHKTSVVKKNVNPHWDYRFFYDNIKLHDLKSKGLELTVWDHDLGTSNDFLGGTRLGLGTGSYDADDARDEEVSIWRTMIEKPNEWVEKLVSLRSSMENRIQLLPPLESDSDSEDAERVQVPEHGTINPSFTEDQPDTDEESHSQTSETSSVLLRSVSDMMINITAVEEPEEIEKPKNKTLVNIVSGETNDGRSARSSSLGQLSVPRLAPNVRRHSDCALPSGRILSPSPLISNGKEKSEKSSSAENIDKSVTHKRKLPKVPQKQRGVLKARSNEDLTLSPTMRRPNQRVSNGGVQVTERRKTLAELAIENAAEKDLKAKENEIAPHIPVPKVKNAHTVDSTDGAKLQRTGSDDSIISTYSDAGSSGGPVVSGELCMAVKYDEKKAIFHVHIHEAKDLAATDNKKNTSDPYVKVYLLPDRSKSGKRRTKVKRKTVNPKYDEILDFKITHNDLLTRTVWVTVWNNDRLGKNDFLGEIYISINDYLKSGQPLSKPLPQWYSLCEKGPAPKVAPIYAGEITLELMFKPGKIKRGTGQAIETVKGQLAVHLIGASNLKGADLDGFSDPFCKCFLLPDRTKKTQLKTPIIKHTCDPIWDHTISYPNVTMEELRTRTLEITVWDYDLTSSSDFLGCVRLGLGTGPNEWEDSREQEAAIWGTMLSRERTWVRAVLPLRASIHSLKES